MKKVATVVPWALVLVLSCIVVLQYRSFDAASTGDEETSAAAEQVQTATPPESAYSELADSVGALRIENENLREMVSSQEEQISTLSVALDAVTQQAARSPASEPAPATQRAENRRLMSAQFAEMQLERRYGPFLANLGLTPDRELAIREALLRVLVDASDDSGLTDTDYAAWMREELTEILSPKELSDFDEYQEGLPEQMLRQSFAGQVNAMAAGLSQETRDVLVNVLVEEALIANLSPPPEDASAAYPLVQRMNIYANTAARFEGTLDETESGVINRFLDLQYAQLQTTLEEIERAEAAGATAAVSIQDGSIRVEIDQRE